MTQILVFGHGAVGREITAILAARGDSVTVAQRRPPASLPAGVRLRLQVVPTWLFPILGLVRRDAYELAEMRFQTDRPYRVDSWKFRSRFELEPTAFEDGLAATLGFYRQQAISG